MLLSSSPFNVRNWIFFNVLTIHNCFETITTTTKMRERKKIYILYQFVYLFFMSFFKYINVKSKYKTVNFHWHSLEFAHTHFSQLVLMYYLDFIRSILFNVDAHTTHNSIHTYLSNRAATHTHMHTCTYTHTQTHSCMSFTIFRNQMNQRTLNRAHTHTHRDIPIHCTPAINKKICY